MRVKGLQPGLKIQDVEFEVKAANDGYTLSGYGSVFGVVDSYREVVDAGAFVDSIAQLKSKGRPLPMLWQHRSAELIGTWDLDKIKEDTRGLYMEGNLLKGVQVAEEARIRALAKAVSGLSIGYYVREDSRDQVTGLTHLKKLDLVETSLVTFPANEDARVDGVKFALDRGRLPPVKDFEAWLRREAGLSQTQAKLVITKGFAELHRREVGAENEVAALKSASEDLAGLLGALDKPLF